MDNAMTLAANMAGAGWRGQEEEGRGGALTLLEHEADIVGKAYEADGAEELLGNHRLMLRCTFPTAKSLTI